MNRRLIPERALPDIHRVADLDCFASLQNIIHHRLSTSALRGQRTGQHCVISGKQGISGQNPLRRIKCTLDAPWLQ